MVQMVFLVVQPTRFVQVRLFIISLRLPYSILMLVILHHEWPIIVLGTGLVGCVLVLLFLKTGMDTPDWMYSSNQTGVELPVTLG